jgi:hypothetical protein
MRHHHSSPSTSTRGTSTETYPTNRPQPSAAPCAASSVPQPSQLDHRPRVGTVPPKAAIEGPAASLANHTRTRLTSATTIGCVPTVLSPPPTAGQPAAGEGGGLEGPHQRRTSAANRNHINPPAEDRTKPPPRPGRSDTTEGPTTCDATFPPPTAPFLKKRAPVEGSPSEPTLRQPTARQHVTSKATTLQTHY